jgi:hypothetical protein
VAAEFPESDRSQRAYEDAVLAALDFAPRDDPIAVTEDERRRWPPRAPGPAGRLALLAAVHVVVAFVFAELMAGGSSGTPLILAGAGWLACTVVIARTILPTGPRLPQRRW